MFDVTPLFVGGMPGTPEMVVILVIAVLLFGANKIPRLARSTGEAMGEFKKGRQEVEQELDEITGEFEEAVPDEDLVDSKSTSDATEE